MSSASLPNRGDGHALPDQAPSRPEIVRPAPSKGRPRGLRWGALAALLLSAGGIYLARSRPPAEKGGGAGAASLRTAAVAFGDLHRTVRLSGTIQAERFAALLAPRLRGDRGSASGNRNSSRNSSSNSSSVSSASSAVSASTTAVVSTNTSTSTSASADTSGASAANATAGSLGATRGSTNRFSDRAAAGRASSSAASGTAASSSTMGSTGLGSTAGNIPPGSSSGGGGSSSSGDFALILMKLPNPGGRVKQGDVVAEFDRVNMLNRIDDYKDAVIQAEAGIRNKQASLAVADEAHRQSVRVAKADMEKAKLDLQTLAVVSDIDAEKLKLAAEETDAHYKQLLKEVPLLKISQTADLRSVKLTRDESKIELQKAVANADRMIMKAPMPGIVVMQSIRRGMEYGQAQLGDQIYPGQPFMEVVDPSSMVMNATVNQVDTEVLRIGMKATVRFDAYPGLRLPAHVFAIGAVPIAGRRPNFMREIPVRLKLDSIDERVVPDLSASAEVALDSEAGAIIAPLASILQDQTQGEPGTKARDRAPAKPYVFVRTAVGWEKREVELGLRNNISVAVRSGLKKGDVVALDPPQEAPQAPSS